MDNKQRARMILFASLVTAAITYAFFTSLTIGTTTDFERIFGYRLGILLALLVLMLVTMAAGIPILLLKLIRKVPNMLGITLFATAEAFWLSYLFVPLAIGLVGWWVILPLKIILVVAMYFAGDALFNIWQAKRSYKIVAAIGIVVFTAI